MALTKFIYPFDLSGASDTNIVSENHVLGTDAYRAIALRAGPFFTDGLGVRERTSGKVLSRGEDYECVFFYDNISELTSGLEVCGVIVVHNTSVSTDIVVTANIVGGPFSATATAIQDAIDALEIGNRNTYWKDVIDKPDLFQPSPHMHDFGDIYGFEFLIDVLGNIRDTLLIGNNAQYKQFVKRLDELEEDLNSKITAHKNEKNNPHKVTASQVNAYDKEEIDAKIQAINKQFTDLGPVFTGITESLSSTNSRISSLIESVNNTNLQFTANAQSLARVHTSIANVTKTSDSIKDDIEEVNKKILSLQDRDKELYNSIQTNSSNITAHGKRLDTNESNITKLGEDLSQINTTLGNRITKNEEDIETAKSSLGSAVQWDRVSKTTSGWSGIINTIPYVRGDGVMRVGKYIDFFESSATTSYSSRLYSNNGTLTTSGNMSVNDIYVRSDRRFKENIKDITPEEANIALSNLKTGKLYNFIGDETPHAGLIAQDVEKEFPVAVATQMDGESKRNRKHLLPYALQALLVSGYTYQSTRITELETELHDIKKHLNLGG